MAKITDIINKLCSHEISKQEAIDRLVDINEGLRRAELRPVTALDIREFNCQGEIIVHSGIAGFVTVSISDEDKKSGSPKIGDMIARNPKNHLDQWLVAKQYFEDNFEEITNN